MNMSVDVKLDASAFNVYWRALHDREQKLQAIIDGHDEESDEAIVANNDIIYLRAVRDSLFKAGKAAGLRDECFELSEEILDLSAI